MLRRSIGVVAVLGIAGWLVFGMVPAASAAGVSTVVNGMTFTADDSDVAAGATLTAYTPGSLHVTIPTAVLIGAQTYQVTSIGTFAFYHDGLLSVVLPSHLTSIGDDAFAQDALSSIVLPSGLTTIGGEVFLNNHLTSVAIPNSVTSMGSEAFMQNALTSVNIGSGLTSLPFNAFATNHIAAITIPPGITTIGVQAFYDNALTTLTVAGSVTSIGSYAFAANHLTSVRLGAPLATIGYSAFNTNDLTSVTFPPTITSLGDAVLIGNPDLTTVVFTGLPPTTFTPAGGGSSLGSNTALVVGYLTGLSATETPGGFTNPWQGFATAELVTTTFDMGGHGAQLDPVLTALGHSPAVPVPPTATHWVFGGWFTDAAFTTPANFSADLDANQTLFARWDPGLPATGGTINVGALWAGLFAAAVGMGLSFLSTRRNYSRP